MDIFDISSWLYYLNDKRQKLQLFPEPQNTSDARDLIARQGYLVAARNCYIAGDSDYSELNLTRLQNNINKALGLGTLSNANDFDVRYHYQVDPRYPIQLPLPGVPHSKITPAYLAELDEKIQQLDTAVTDLESGELDTQEPPELGDDMDTQDQPEMETASQGISPSVAAQLAAIREEMETHSQESADSGDIGLGQDDDTLGQAINSTPEDIEITAFGAAPPVDPSLQKVIEMHDALEQELYRPDTDANDMHGGDSSLAITMLGDQDNPHIGETMPCTLQPKKNTHSVEHAYPVWEVMADPDENAEKRVGDWNIGTQSLDTPELIAKKYEDMLSPFALWNEANTLKESDDGRKTHVIEGLLTELLYRCFDNNTVRIMKLKAFHDDAAANYPAELLINTHVVPLFSDIKLFKPVLTQVVSWQIPGLDKPGWLDNVTNPAKSDESVSMLLTACETGMPPKEYQLAGQLYDCASYTWEQKHGLDKISPAFNAILGQVRNIREQAVAASFTAMIAKMELMVPSMKLKDAPNKPKFPSRGQIQTALSYPDTSQEFKGIDISVKDIALGLMHDYVADPEDSCALQKHNIAGLVTQHVRSPSSVRTQDTTLFAALCVGMGLKDDLIACYREADETFRKTKDQLGAFKLKQAQLTLSLLELQNKWKSKDPNAESVIQIFIERIARTPNKVTIMPIITALQKVEHIEEIYYAQKRHSGESYARGTNPQTHAPYIQHMLSGQDR